MNWLTIFVEGSQRNASPFFFHRQILFLILLLLSVTCATPLRLSVKASKDSFAQQVALPPCRISPSTTTNDDEEHTHTSAIVPSATSIC